MSKFTSPFLPQQPVIDKSTNTFTTPYQKQMKYLIEDWVEENKTYYENKSKTPTNFSYSISGCICHFIYDPTITTSSSQTINLPYKNKSKFLFGDVIVNEGMEKIDIPENQTFTQGFYFIQF